MPFITSYVFICTHKYPCPVMSESMYVCMYVRTHVCVRACVRVCDVCIRCYDAYGNMRNWNDSDSSLMHCTVPSEW